MDPEILTRRAEIARRVRISAGCSSRRRSDSPTAPPCPSRLRPATRFPYRAGRRPPRRLARTVPRIWEKIEAAIKAGLAAEQDPARRAAVERAREIGLRYIEATQLGRPAPGDLAGAFRQAGEQVLQPIRAYVGLGAAANGISAAAPLPIDLARYFASLGFAILDVYGMTETTGAFTSNTAGNFKLGTVGRPLPGVEVRIAADGEVLARAPLCTPGYLNLPEATAALIDADGWLHTGDIGALDGDGFLSITGRKKEMIITAGGENVGPAGVEGLLTENPLIGQALCYGDRRPYIIALLTLDGDAARQ